MLAAVSELLDVVDNSPAGAITSRDELTAAEYRIWEMVGELRACYSRDEDGAPNVLTEVAPRPGNRPGGRGQRSQGCSAGSNPVEASEVVQVVRLVVGGDEGRALIICPSFVREVWRHEGRGGNSRSVQSANRLRYPSTPNDMYSRPFIDEILNG